MIRVTDVTKTFNSGRHNEFTAVSGVSAIIRPHEVTVLKGPSGSGKTTLLGLMGCMARPSSGRIYLDDREITSLPERLASWICMRALPGCSWRSMRRSRRRLSARTRPSLRVRRAFTP